MARRYQKPAGHCGADFSRTCEGCGCITVETVAGLPPLFRCNAPGPRRGYTVSNAGRFLPYVPAWCPILEAELKKIEAETYADYRAYVKDWAIYGNEEETPGVSPLTYEEWKEENAG